MKVFVDMNIAKLTAPDFMIGKTLVTAKALVDIVALLIVRPERQSVRLARLILQVKPRFTMVKNINLINLYQLVREANRLRLEGDIVECGVWNGGSAAVMAVACIDDESQMKQRTFWLFDSFQGLPAPGERDGNVEKDMYFAGWNKGEIAKVKRIFDQVGVPPGQLRIIPGWFEATLKSAHVQNIAVLHVDADWYDSVKEVLDTFYDKVVPGGFVVLDDYGLWQGCRQAMTDFFAERGIKDVPIRSVGRDGAYFQKAM
jgi:O-methyltransferase